MKKLKQRHSLDFKIHPLRHYQIVNNLLPDKEIKILDYGCGTGDFIGNLQNKKWSITGIEVDQERLACARKAYPHLKLYEMKVGQRLPFKTNTFDVVTLFHVLEHVDSEKEALSEIHRVLKKNGILYLASPYKGLFTWADTANLRYSFPVLHKYTMYLLLGKKVYDSRFKEKALDKLYGDCSINRTWHRHYKENEVRRLLQKNFDVLNFAKFSLFHPLLLLLYNFANYVTGRHLFFTKYLLYLDNCINAGEFSYNMLVTCRKK